MKVHLNSSFSKYSNYLKRASAFVTLALTSACTPGMHPNEWTTEPKSSPTPSITATASPNDSHLAPSAPTATPSASGVCYERGTTAYEKAYKDYEKALKKHTEWQIKRTEDLKLVNEGDKTETLEESRRLRDYSQAESARIERLKPLVCKDITKLPTKNWLDVNNIASRFSYRRIVHA